MLPPQRCGTPREFEQPVPARKELSAALVSVLSSPEQSLVAHLFSCCAGRFEKASFIQPLKPYPLETPPPGLNGTQGSIFLQQGCLPVSGFAVTVAVTLYSS